MEIRVVYNLTGGEPISTIIGHTYLFGYIGPCHKMNQKMVVVYRWNKKVIKKLHCVVVGVILVLSEGGSLDFETKNKNIIACIFFVVVSSS